MHFKGFVCLRMHKLHAECQIPSDAHDWCYIVFALNVPKLIPKYWTTKTLSQFLGWSIRSLAQYITCLLHTFACLPFFLCRWVSKFLKIGTFIFWLLRFCCSLMDRDKESLSWLFGLGWKSYSSFPYWPTNTTISHVLNISCIFFHLHNLIMQYEI